MPAEPQPLNARTLGYWAGRLPVPTYDRRLVTPGVVHVGVGGFHRAHQAMYHDRLMNQGGAASWGICGGLVWLLSDADPRPAVRALGGHATLYRGEGVTFEPLDGALAALTARVKAAFDPKGVLNPGRMVG